MNIETYQKATEILESINRIEEKQNDLAYFHDRLVRGDCIKITSEEGHVKVALSGDDAIHFVELLLSANKKAIATLKAKLKRL